MELELVRAIAEEATVKLQKKNYIQVRGLQTIAALDGAAISTTIRELREDEGAVVEATVSKDERFTTNIGSCFADERGGKRKACVEIAATRAIGRACRVHYAGLLWDAGVRVEGSTYDEMDGIGKKSGKTKSINDNDHPVTTIEPKQAAFKPTDEVRSEFTHKMRTLQEADDKEAMKELHKQAFDVGLRWNSNTKTYYIPKEL